MARSYAKDRFGTGPRKYRRTSACGRDCWVCHGPKARNDRTAERRAGKAAVRAEREELTAAPWNECLGSCAYCDSDPLDQVRCYE